MFNEKCMPHNAHEPSYKSLLKKVLSERMVQNDNYSLRKFARDLGLYPSQLSSILNDKCGLSPEKASQICPKLGLSEKESRFFVDSVKSLHTRTKWIRKREQQKINEHLKIDNVFIEEEKFRLICDWYHYALLEVISLEQFVDDTHWMGRCLGISPLLIKQAMERLMHLDLLEKSDKGFKASGKNTWATDEVPSESVREFHRQLLRKAAQAIGERPLEDREFQSVIMGIHRDKVKEAKKWIKEFKDKFCTHIHDTPKKNDAIYCFAIQFFQLNHEVSV